MITIADFIGNVDQSGKPVGHPVKVVSEMAGLLSGEAEVSVAAPEAHLGEIRKQGSWPSVPLPHCVNVFSHARLRNLLGKWRNLRMVFRKSGDVLWFAHVDFSLFLYLFLFGCRGRRVWLTLCYNPLRNAGGWRHHVVERVLKRVDKVIATNRNFLNLLPGNTVFVPDYYCREAFYGEFLCDHKRREMVSLGTTGETKQLEALVEVMNGCDVPLTIAGSFAQSPERCARLKAMAKPHIQIVDGYIGNNEYYTRLAGARYVVLPYDMKLYEQRTSGILLESVFLESIPVVPRALLEFNGIDGIGYDRLEEIPALLGDTAREAEILENNRRLKNTLFSETEIRRKLLDEA